MDVTEYERRMAEMGIGRGNFEPDKQFPYDTASVSYSREPRLVNPTASERVYAPPLEEDLSVLNPRRSEASQNTALTWWEKLTEQERREVLAKRARTIAERYKAGMIKRGGRTKGARNSRPRVFKGLVLTSAGAV